MDSIADIIPKALRQGGLGRKIREQEALEAFEAAADIHLPGDLRSAVRGLYLRSAILTVASLSGYASRILKEQEAEIIAYIKRKYPDIKVQKIRVIA